MKVRIHCDRCNHGLLGDSDDLNYGKHVVDMMIKHRNNSEYLELHRAGTVVYFPHWIVTFLPKQEMMT